MIKKIFSWFKKKPKMKPIVHNGTISIKNGNWFVDKVFPLSKEDVDRIEGYKKSFDNVEARILASPNVIFTLEENEEEGIVYANLIV